MFTLTFLPFLESLVCGQTGTKSIQTHFALVSDHKKQNFHLVQYEAATLSLLKQMLLNQSSRHCIP
jgi:hypothetical protein